MMKTRINLLPSWCFIWMSVLSISHLSGSGPVPKARGWVFLDTGYWRWTTRPADCFEWKWINSARVVNLFSVVTNICTTNRILWFCTILHLVFLRLKVNNFTVNCCFIALLFICYIICPYFLLVKFGHSFPFIFWLFRLSALVSIML